MVEPGGTDYLFSRWAKHLSVPCSNEIQTSIISVLNLEVGVSVHWTWQGISPNLCGALLWTSHNLWAQFYKTWANPSRIASSPVLSAVFFPSSNSWPSFLCATWRTHSELQAFPVQAKLQNINILGKEKIIFHMGFLFFYWDL